VTKRVSITDVARAAEVTVAVVSRVLNADPTLQIRPETRERVLAAARGLDYTPSHAARAMRGGRSYAIGLAVHDISNPVYGGIIRGAQMAATEAGYVLLLADVEALAQGDSTFRRAIHGGAIDGLLLLRAGDSADRRVLRNATQRIPTVLVNDRSTTYASVALDDAAGARLATQHLIDLGHRRIGHLRLGGTARSGARLRGWREALHRAGIAENPCWILDADHLMETGYEAMQRMAALDDLPTGVFVANILAGIGAMSAARDAGLSVPADISIIAYHDLPYAAHLVPALTTVDMPLQKLGASAVTLLLEQLAGAEPRHVVLHDPAPSLVIRSSTARPRRRPSARLR
jgi:DNA-binding LacI/PurR family transcriptional regulator